MLDWLIDIRREFHRFPETAHEEFKTTARIKEILTGLGVEIMDCPDLKSGVVGMIRCSQDGPTLGLRADIDALNVTELNEVPYKSLQEGKMHACGHDGHTTILLGVTKQILETGLIDDMRGNIKLLFQPAEERLTGAEKMIDAGALESPNVDMILCAHMLPDLPVGHMGICREYSHAASDHILLLIKGKGSHAARPHQGIDPIVAGAHFLTASQSVISRNISPIEPAVITFGRLQAGTAFNIIPETAELEGTIRSLKPEIREQILRRLQEQAQGLESMFGVETEFKVLDGVAACYNHEPASELLTKAAEKTVGPDAVTLMEPIMGSEDFALYTEKVPGAIFRTGCGNKDKGFTYPLHSPRFDLDETSLLLGMNVFMEAIKIYLGRK